jgi:hypothetical protein
MVQDLTHGEWYESYGDHTVANLRFLHKVCRNKIFYVKFYLTYI